MNKFVALILISAACVVSSATAASAFKFSFSWGGIPRCTTGHPNTVNNPTFRLSGVPKNTTRIVFRMRDRDAPGYNHGGGTVKYTGKNTIRPGAFRYKSPCPPGGRHTYVWTGTAYDKNGKKLGSATSSKRYP